MDAAPEPKFERARIQALRDLEILDTPPEERFDRYTRMARRLFDVQIALVSLVDVNRQWFKSRQGLDATETPRDISFCGHVVACDEPLVVRDTHDDPRFADNPLVESDPRIRFYAGVPVRSIDGQPLGTVCLIDRRPREMSDDDLATLRDLAAMVEGEFAAQRAATTDHLTGLSNRRGFRAIGEHALTVSERLGLPATLLVFDLDGFKGVNDAHGHAEGDRALRAFGDSLRSTYRQADVIARVGGDEFVVLCTGADATAVEATLARLDAALDAAHAAGATRARVEFSAGTVRVDRSIASDIDQMLDLADRRMYRQKRSARLL